MGEKVFFCSIKCDIIITNVDRKGFVMDKFIIERSNEDIMPLGGLALAGYLLEKTNLESRLNCIPIKGIRNLNKLENFEVVTSYLGLLLQGKNSFENIEEFRGDIFFSSVLGIENVPSSSRLRQRLDLMPTITNNVIKEESVSLLKKANVKLSACIDDHIPLDIDVTPFDNSNSKKEGVSFTYKKFMGYAPIMAYLGQHEGYLVNTELRIGKQHCQKNTPEFLKNSIKYAKKVTDDKICVRMDSGNDASKNIEICLDESVDFIIKRNLRGEDRRKWYKKALVSVERGVATKETLREGKYLIYGKKSIMPSKLDQKITVPYKITVQSITDEGQYIMIPEIEVETFWTSMDYDAKTIVNLYHSHATSEQFHSEIKTDMDLERLPSGKFKTNDLILHIGSLAYNILRIIGQKTIGHKNVPIRKKVKRRRLKTVIKDMILLAAKYVRHARQKFIKIGRSNKWFGVIKSLYDEIIPC